MLFGFKVKWILHDLNQTAIVCENHNDNILLLFMFDCNYERSPLLITFQPLVCKSVFLSSNPGGNSAYERGGDACR